MKAKFNSAGALARWLAAAAIALALFVPISAHAQDPPAPSSKPASPDSTTPPSAQPAAPPKSSAPSSNQPPSGNAAQEQPQIYDPYHAMKSMEIGEFYLKKGDADAAMDRFQDAIRYKYDFARPRLLIGQIYEKRHDDANAIRYYTEYLKILPEAPDAKKIKERIDKLSRHMQAADARQPSQH
jgi:tetratricopeptide (TPR) repeat protein